MKGLGTRHRQAKIRLPPMRAFCAGGIQTNEAISKFFAAQQNCPGHEPGRFGYDPNT